METKRRLWIAPVYVGVATVQTWLAEEGAGGQNPSVGAILLLALFFVIPGLALTSVVWLTERSIRELPQATAVALLVATGVAAAVSFALTGVVLTGHLAPFSGHPPPALVLNEFVLALGGGAIFVALVQWVVRLTSWIAIRLRGTSEAKARPDLATTRSVATGPAATTKGETRLEDEARGDEIVADDAAMSACHACGTVLAPGARFCSSCGAAVQGLPEGSPRPGDRASAGPVANLRRPSLRIIVIGSALLAVVVGLVLVRALDPAPRAWAEFQARTERFGGSNPLAHMSFGYANQSIPSSEALIGDATDLERAANEEISWLLRNPPAECYAAAQSAWDIYVSRLPPYLEAAAAWGHDRQFPQPMDGGGKNLGLASDRYIAVEAAHSAWYSAASAVRC